MDDERLRAMRETGRRKVRPARCLSPARRQPAPASSRSPATRLPALIRAPPPPAPPASPLAPQPPPPQLDAFRRAKARRAAESAEAAAAKPPARPRRGRRARPPASSKSGVADLASLAAFDDASPPPRRAPLAPLAMNDAAARGDATSSVLAMRAALATARREKAALRAENASLREDVARLEDLVDGLARLLEASGADSSGFDAGEEEGEATTTRNRSERTAAAARAETRGGDGAGTVAIARARASGARLPAEDAVLAEDASSDPFAEFDAFLGGDAATNFKEEGAEEGDASAGGGLIGRRRDGDGEGGGGLERRGDGGERDAAPPRTFGDECAEDPLDAWLAGAVAATPLLFLPRGDVARTLDSAAELWPGAPKDLGDSPFDRRSEAVKGGVEGGEVGGAGRGGAAKRAS